MIMDPAMARENRVAFYRACTVREVDGYNGYIFLSGPDRKRLYVGFEPGQLAVPGEDVAWLPLHLAVAEGREEGVVRRLHDAWPEAVGIGPRED